MKLERKGFFMPDEIKKPENDNGGLKQEEVELAEVIYERY